MDFPLVTGMPAAFSAATKFEGDMFDWNVSSATCIDVFHGRLFRQGDVSKVSATSKS